MAMSAPCAPCPASRARSSANDHRADFHGPAAGGVIGAVSPCPVPPFVAADTNGDDSSGSIADRKSHRFIDVEAEPVVDVESDDVVQHADRPVEGAIICSRFRAR